VLTFKHSSTLPRYTVLQIQPLPLLSVLKPATPAVDVSAIDVDAATRNFESSVTTVVTASDCEALSPDDSAGAAQRRSTRDRGPKSTQRATRSTTSGSTASTVKKPSQVKSASKPRHVNRDTAAAKKNAPGPKAIPVSPVSQREQKHTASVAEDRILARRLTHQDEKISKLEKSKASLENKLATTKQLTGQLQTKSVASATRVLEKKGDGQAVLDALAMRRQKAEAERVIEKRQLQAKSDFEDAKHAAEVADWESERRHQIALRELARTAEKERAEAKRFAEAAKVQKLVDAEAANVELAKNTALEREKQAEAARVEAAMRAAADVAEVQRSGAVYRALETQINNGIAVNQLRQGDADREKKRKDDEARRDRAQQDRDEEDANARRKRRKLDGYEEESALARHGQQMAAQARMVPGDCAPIRYGSLSPQQE
jgi:hypothetical protein